MIFSVTICYLHSIVRSWYIAEKVCVPISWALPPPSCSIMHCLVIKPGSQENPRYSLIVSWLKHPATHPMASSGISQHSHVDFRRVYLFYLHYTPVISHWITCLLVRLPFLLVKSPFQLPPCPSCLSFSGARWHEGVHPTDLTQQLNDQSDAKELTLAWVAWVKPSSSQAWFGCKNLQETFRKPWFLRFLLIVIWASGNDRKLRCEWFYPW